MLYEIGPGENGFVNRGFDLSPEDFGEFLRQQVNSDLGLNLGPGLVPQTWYWLRIDQKLVGYGKLRHSLNEQLRKMGGHVGYTVRPLARGKGYGTILLREILAEAKGIGIDRALVTCSEYNSPSRRVIENNGGLLEDTTDEGCRYWINLA